MVTLLEIGVGGSFSRFKRSQRYFIVEFYKHLALVRNELTGNEIYHRSDDLVFRRKTRKI